MTEHIRVELLRSGGFIGRSVHVTLDSTQLPPPEAAELTRLVTAIDPHTLRSTGPTHGADLMHYNLTIHRGTQQWQVKVSDPAIPADLSPLLQFLNNYS
ncbi:protealysin inhibitor emfourin [Paractinoplanes durhamensis]|uniref:Uncharacterized protein n=1 Tax=Paractinoplanes durhamensis TaxID=113563 RepID=A0ABQ3Z570_9ACTN|nr:protealysin inhibitor emfourin [Actinoplanes durhamensis]GIE04936.1 hypothetical protein Adu01nite_62860 [Actinoplanes durhamensis]